MNQSEKSLQIRLNFLLRLEVWEFVINVNLISLPEDLVKDSEESRCVYFLLPITVALLYIIIRCLVTFTTHLTSLLRLENLVATAMTGGLLGCPEQSTPT
jgi:hypothetical protein